ncbi:MAG: hypothetical protein Q8Q14_06560 [Gemmatimonadales bacterium]|nr:hypothetical protein [Gemmatimonadales bacterium]
MIQVSGIAREYLERLRARASLDRSQQAIRLVPGPAGQLGLLPGVTGVGDTVIPHRGRPLLLIASEVARCLGTVVLDVASESGREQLVLRRSTRTSGRSLGTLNGGSWSSSRV